MNEIWETCFTYVHSLKRSGGKSLAFIWHLWCEDPCIRQIIVPVTHVAPSKASILPFLPTLIISFRPPEGSGSCQKKLHQLLYPTPFGISGPSCPHGTRCSQGLNPPQSISRLFMMKNSTYTSHHLFKKKKRPQSSISLALVTPSTA